MAKKKFELSDAKSHKFWDIELKGNTVITYYGRIGTKGQTAQKEFEDQKAAKQHRDKLIEQKTSKGYQAVVGKRTAATPSSKKATTKKNTKKAASKQNSSAKRKKSNNPFEQKLQDDIERFRSSLLYEPFTWSQVTECTYNLNQTDNDKNHVEHQLWFFVGDPDLNDESNDGYDIFIRQTTNWQGQKFVVTKCYDREWNFLSKRSYSSTSFLHFSNELPNDQQITHTSFSQNGIDFEIVEFYPFHQDDEPSHVILSSNLIFDLIGTRKSFDMMMDITRGCKLKF